MKAELIKILKGAIIAACGAGLTYLLEAVGKIDFGTATPLVVSGFSVLVNILRKLLVAWGMKVLAVVALLCLMVMPVKAQNLPSFFSSGPTLPFYTVTWDDSGSATSGLLNAGAGYSLNFNFMPSESGQYRMLNIGIPIFLNVPSGDVMNLSAGLTLGTLNNFVAVGVAGDLVHAGPGPDTGLMIGDFSKQNIRLLLSFGFNVGSGTPNPMASKANKILGTFYEPAPPPGYFKLW